MLMNTENKKAPYFHCGNCTMKKRKNFQFVELHGILDILIYLQSHMDHVR